MQYNRRQRDDSAPSNLVLTFIVQPSPKTIELLNYLNREEVVSAINLARLKVKFERITPKRKEMLEREKVRGMPVMIAPDKSFVAGPDEIIRQLGTNILKRAPRKQRQPQPYDDEGGGEPDIMDQLCDEIYAGVGRRSGKKGSQLVVPVEQETTQGETFDPDREMRNFRKPSHWQTKTDEDDIDDGDGPEALANAPVTPARTSSRQRAQPRQAPRRKPQPRQQQYTDDEDEDNIPDGEPMNDSPLETYDHMTGGANDDDTKMMRALLAGMGNTAQIGGL